MTKTELAEKILSYDSTARLDITTAGSASNMPIKVLQELVAEWREQNVPKPMYKGFDYYITDGKERPVGGWVTKIPEPDKDTPPDFNC